MLGLQMHSDAHKSIVDLIGNFSQGIFHFRGLHEKVSLNVAI